MHIHRHVTAVLLTALAAAGHAQPMFQENVLTDPAGRTLYVFDKDQPGVSNCKDACLKAWPVYGAEPGSGMAPPQGASRIASGQWAWNDMPLYYYAGDAKPGDKAGDGRGGFWHIVTMKAMTDPGAAKPAR